MAELTLTPVLEETTELTFELLESNTFISSVFIHESADLQPREGLNLKHVQSLVEALEDNKSLDPVVIFYDELEGMYWLVDGHHRLAAYREAQIEDVFCDIYKGDFRTALLYSSRANAENKACLPRTKDEKLKAAIKLLLDIEYQSKSDREIASLSKLTNSFVSKVRNVVRVLYHPDTENLDNGAVGELTKTSTVFVARVRKELGLKNIPVPLTPLSLPGWEEPKESRSKYQEDNKEDSDDDFEEDDEIEPTKSSYEMTDEEYEIQRAKDLEDGYIFIVSCLKEYSKNHLINLRKEIDRIIPQSSIEELKKEIQGLKDENEYLVEQLKLATKSKD